MNICIVDRGGKIPAQKYGGTERVIWGLGKELQAMGHNITFLVPEGSTSDFARIIPLDRNAPIETQIPKDIDLVHLNFKPQDRISRPYLITMHGNPAPAEEIDVNTVFISRNQAARHNSEVFVYNGLSWEDYPQPDLTRNRNSFHFLGKASWKIKNAAGAIKIASKNNLRLNIIGGKKWTERNIKSSFRHLFNPRIRFKGFLDDNAKTRIMEKSKGLIFPVLWHEPFGLAIIESLYAGCAVFGTKYGSLEELVTPEVGFTGNSLNEIAKAIDSFKHDPQKCHDYAVDNFNSRRMAEDYCRLYDRVLSGKPLNRIPPVYNPKLNAITPLQ